MASLSLKNIVKKYPNGFEAVKDFNLEIADKEFVIFVGPSGCGKSTTLRMIAGLEDISAGELYIDGKLMNDVEPKDRDIAMVFQNYALYPHMTVYDNMAFGLKLRKTPKDEIDKLVHEAARILDLEHLLDRKPKPFLLYRKYTDLFLLFLLILQWLFEVFDSKSWHILLFRKFTLFYINAKSKKKQASIIPACLKFHKLI